MCLFIFRFQGDHLLKKPKCGAVLQFDDTSIFCETNLAFYLKNKTKIVVFILNVFGGKTIRVPINKTYPFDMDAFMKLLANG